MSHKKTHRSEKSSFRTFSLDPSLKSLSSGLPTETEWFCDQNHPNKGRRRKKWWHLERPSLSPFRNWRFWGQWSNLSNLMPHKIIHALCIKSQMLEQGFYVSNQRMGATFWYFSGYDKPLTKLSFSWIFAFVGLEDRKKHPRHPN